MSEGDEGNHDASQMDDDEEDDDDEPENRYLKVFSFKTNQICPELHASQPADEHPSILFLISFTFLRDVCCFTGS